MQPLEIIGLIAEFFTTYSIEKATPQTRNDVITRCRNLIAEEVDEVRAAWTAVSEHATYDPVLAANLLGEMADVRYVTAYARFALDVPATAHTAVLPPPMIPFDLPRVHADFETAEDIARQLDRIDAAINGYAKIWKFPLDEAIRAVHAANLNKIWPDGQIHRREDGKVLKPPQWTPPDLASLLAA